MKSRVPNRYLAMSAAVAAALTAPAVHALDFTGFVRAEPSYSLSSEANPFNQNGNIFNGVTVNNATLGGSQTRPASFSDEPDWNMMNFRAEIDGQHRFSDNLSAYVKFRTYFDQTQEVEDVYEEVDFFGVPFNGSRRATLLETNEDNWMADFPALYLDYNKGPLWLRFGNQQIAWGEAIFFRVMDVPNGLDLRRHAFLDVAGEEYSDERVASPALRGSYSFDNGFEIDAFVQKFSPTVLPNENTPYNIIPSQFVINQEPGYDQVDNEWNYGARLTMPVTDSLTIIAMAVDRHNPDGVFRWSEAQGPNAIVGTPFEMDPRGVYSSEEWFTYAGMARLDGVKGVDSVYQDFASAEALRTFFGLPQVTDRASARTNLDAFFGTVGPLRGWLTREYPSEKVYGIGANYIFNAEPGSFLDQLVVRGELTYTPDRKFTNPSLSRNYIEEDEIVLSLIAEKYQRFSEDFPATFMVFEWLYKSESDLFGRHLSGMDNDGEPKGVNNYNAFVFAALQPFPNLIWRADLAVLVDTRGGWLVQPGVRYKPSANWQFDVYANFIGGSGNDDALQTFDFADEIFARFTRYF